MKKRERDRKVAAQKEAAAASKKQAAKALSEKAFKRAEKYVQEYRALENGEIRNRRLAKQKLSSVSLALQLDSLKHTHEIVTSTHMNPVQIGLQLTNCAFMWPGRPVRSRLEHPNDVRFAFHGSSALFFARACRI